MKLLKRIGLWMYWCWQFKDIMPWNVSLIDNRNLTEKELDYADTIEILYHIYKAR